jgi:hypothetical protein
MKAQLKLHKPHIAIRPAITNTQAPTYKVPKHLTKILGYFLTPTITTSPILQT